MDDQGVVWGAFKAYLRGRLTQHSSDQLSKLEIEIKNLERQYAMYRSLNRAGSIEHLNSIIQRKAEFSFFGC